MTAFDEHEIPELNRRFEDVSAAQVIEWASERFMPRIAATSSFQTQSVALLHIISLVRPDLPVIFLDTGYHFPETLSFRDKLSESFGLNLRIIRPRMSKHDLAEKYGEALYRRDPDLCCYINKVEPMQFALKELDAWISGIRREQTANRSGAQIVEALPDGRIKINPVATWSHSDLWSYIHKNNLPVHPLFGKGYLSIGCAPCTKPVTKDMDERSGRWSESSKTECGLHSHFVTLTAADAQRSAQTPVPEEYREGGLPPLRAVQAATLSTARLEVPQTNDRQLWPYLLEELVFDQQPVHVFALEPQSDEAPAASTLTTQAEPGKPE